MLNPGDIIGNYEVESVLGAGGMGVVYAVRHRHFDTRHAVKVLADIYNANESVRARFIQEGKLQAKLDHPNIVSVTDLIETPQAFAMVLELVEGKALDQMLDTSSPAPWPVADVLTLIRPILGALAHAHEQGVVHRDLKPANVMLEADDIHAPRVVDFGIAKVLGTEQRTRTGARMGTIPYMAPEQFMGKTDLDARVDVFSLGVLLWELLVGRLPVDDENMMEVMEFYSGRSPLPPLSEVAPGLPHSLSSVLEQALAMDRALRFKDAGVFLSAIDHAMEQAQDTVVLGEAPVDSPAVASAGPSESFSEVSQMSAAATSGAAAEDKEPDSSPQPRNRPGPILALGLTLLAVIAIASVMTVFQSEETLETVCESACANMTVMGGVPADCERLCVEEWTMTEARCIAAAQSPEAMELCAGDEVAEPVEETLEAEPVEETLEMECAVTCRHIMTLTMSRLPADTTDGSKAKIMETLKDRCPVDCLKHATPENIKCVMAAKTATELLACSKHVTPENIKCVMAAKTATELVVCPK